MRLRESKRAGFIVTGEVVAITTIMVIGLIVGWVTLRNAIAEQMAEKANAIGALDQSYDYDGLSIDGASSSGSTYQDDGPETYVILPMSPDDVPVPDLPDIPDEPQALIRAR